jgi:hypothetical protein
MTRPNARRDPSHVEARVLPLPGQLGDSGGKPTVLCECICIPLSDATCTQE